MAYVVAALWRAKEGQADTILLVIEKMTPLSRVEGLVNLAQLPPRCQFFAPFYHFAGIDSAPARAFALVEE